MATASRCPPKPGWCATRSRGLGAAPAAGRTAAARRQHGGGAACPRGGDLAALLDSCGDDLVGLRDGALLSLAYDGGLRVSELVALAVSDLRSTGDGSGRGEIACSKTDQDGEGALVWLSADTMARDAAWREASGISFGPVLRRVTLLPARERLPSHRCADRARGTECRKLSCLVPY